MATRQSIVRAADYELPDAVHDAVAAVFGLHGLPLPPMKPIMPKAGMAIVTPDVIKSTYKIAGVEPTRSPENRQAVVEFQALQFADRKELRAFAGLCSWIASVVPIMKSFVAMVWAAATSKPAGQETARWVAIRRVRLPLAWLHAFAIDSDSLAGPRLFPVNRDPIGPCLVFDVAQLMQHKGR